MEVDPNAQNANAAPTVPDVELPGVGWMKVFQKFDGKPGNWLTYIDQFEAICKLLGIWFVVSLSDEHAAAFDVPLGQPGALEATEVAKYRRINECLYCAFIVTIDASTASRLKTRALKDNGRAVYKYLLNYFQSASAHRASHLLNMLLQMSWPGPEPAAVALSRVIAARDELQRIGSPIPNDMLMTLVQRMLPPRYAALKTWLIGAERQTIETILTKATEIDLATATFGATILDVNATSTTTSTGPDIGRGTRPKHHCYYCGKHSARSHVWRTCPDRLAEAERGIYRVTAKDEPTSKDDVIATITKRYNARVATGGRAQFSNRSNGNPQTFRAQFTEANSTTEHPFTITDDAFELQQVNPDSAMNSDAAVDPFDISHGFHGEIIDTWDLNAVINTPTPTTPSTTQQRSTNRIYIPGHRFSFMVDSGCSKSLTPTTDFLQTFEAVAPNRFKVKAANDTLLDVTWAHSSLPQFVQTAQSPNSSSITSWFVPQHRLRSYPPKLLRETRTARSRLGKMDHASR